MAQSFVCKCLRSGSVTHKADFVVGAGHPSASGPDDKSVWIQQKFTSAQNIVKKS